MRLCLLLALTGCSRTITLTPATTALPADGRIHRIATVSEDDLIVTGATLDNRNLLVRSPITPTQRRLILHRAHATKTLTVAFTEDEAPSSAAPPVPDWFPLHTAEDRDSFRRWFTAVADRAADLPPAKLPAEISDCSALLRYSLREALRAHDDKWYADAGRDMPTLPSVLQWTYPDTPMGTGLFRTHGGVFTANDLKDNTFAQFADAKTLVSANTFFLSRNLNRAHPGDLIFYRLLEDGSQYHSMIVTGPHADWVVYHTGPVNHTKGEMRRVLLADLIHHPDPRWRPIPSNENFLGVYRWNLLAEDR
jgi:uncharacterized protein YfaT (DUF1175 family)